MRMIASGLAAAGLTLVLNVTTTAAAPITFSASGTSPAGIQTTVDAYRTDLGTLNPNVAGSFGSGRREINWDAVPDAFSAPNLFSPTFFNTNRSEEHTSELQSQSNLVCRLLLEKKNIAYPP